MSDHDTEEFLKGHRVNEASDDLDDYADVVFAENFKLAFELKQVRAQLAAAQERVGELENERFTLRQILHDIAFFSFVVDGRWHPEYERGWNAAIERITQDAQKHFTDKGISADDFDKLDEQLAQRDAEIARLKQSLKRVMSHSPEDRDIDINDGC